MGEYRKMKVSDLRPHPKNAEIYGQNENVSDLVEKIKRSGQVHTLVVTSKGTVLAGHRRLKACKELGIEEVDVEIIDFDTPEQEVEYLIDNNATREKTEVQRAREARELKKVETILAKKRQSDNGGDKKSDKYKSEVTNSPHTDSGKSGVANLPHVDSDKSGQGKARDNVAKKMNYKSGREVDRAIKTINKIDELEGEGRKEEAELVRDVMNNRSISAAESLAKNIDNIRLSEEQKEEIRVGRKSPNFFIKKIDKDKEQPRFEVKSVEPSDNVMNLENTLAVIQKRYQEYLLVFQEDIKWLSDKVFYCNDEEVSGKTHSELQNCLEKFKSISNVMGKMVIDEFGCITIDK